MKIKLSLASLLAAAAATVSGCASPATSFAGSTVWGAALAHQPGHYPRIIVENNVSAAWPVAQAVSSWNVPVTYGRCMPNVNCVRFTQVSSLGDNRVGLTWRPVSAGPETVTIQLAANPQENALQATQDVAHEFGHALGLGHDDIGVMNPVITGAYLGPNPAELARVRSIYLG